ncbi:MAG TPA: TIGR02281 family clan AA aspartic protease [Usitatibacter sp.]|nr:TIGR02281 family clan AA aspartic protease [Usitatibacter sp.]
MPSLRIRQIAAALCALAACGAGATDVNVIGLFPGKAVLVIDRGPPRTVSAGERTPEGVLLISADSKGAVVEIDGKRQALEMGQSYETAAPQSDSRPTVTLPADSRGQFYASGQVNGSHVRFMVDTGATSVLLPASEARRLGIDYRKGEPGRIQTANGSAQAWHVTLDSVTVGSITAYDVDAVVAEAQGLDVALLGMSFLNRTEMRRDGAYMTLTKRY